MRHIIWDWNGTLLNDIEIILQATNAYSKTIGRDSIDLQTYRSHNVRPFRLLYERLAGRTLEDDEVTAISQAFGEKYMALLPEAQLADDATDALEMARRAGISQSLLSLWTHDDLLELVRKFGVDEYFVLIEGITKFGEGKKYDALVRHLQSLATVTGGLKPDDILLIGDVADDAEAAEKAGIDCILVATGMDSRENLELTGRTVCDNLADALGAAGLNNTAPAE